MSGLVQSFSLQSDDIKILENAIKILLVWNSKVTSYRTGVDYQGVPYLALMWADKSDSGKPSTPLMAPLTSADAIAHQIYAWLSSAQYPEMPDIDGSCERGYKVTHGCDYPVVEKRQVGAIGRGTPYDVYDSSFYDVVVVRPAWIEYHK